jgi:hypothetical protein
MKQHLKRAWPWLITLLLALFLARQGGDWRQAPAGRLSSAAFPARRQGDCCPGCLAALLARRWGSRAVEGLARAWDRWIVRRCPDRLAAWSGDRLLARARYLRGELLTLLRTRPYAIGGSLLAHVSFEVLGLATCFYALGQPLPPATLLLLYVLTVGVNTLGGLPGLAEVSLAALYTQFGLDPGRAVAVALVYRLTDYWLPRAAGGLLWVWMERRTGRRLRQEVIP